MFSLFRISPEKNNVDLIDHKKRFDPILKSIEGVGLEPSYTIVNLC